MKKKILMLLILPILASQMIDYSTKTPASLKEEIIIGERTYQAETIKPQVVSAVQNEIFTTDQGSISFSLKNVRPVSITHSGNGLRIDSFIYLIRAQRLNVQVTLLNVNSSLTITTIYDDYPTIQTIIYFEKITNDCYSMSTTSKDNAKVSGYQYLYNNNRISEEVLMELTNMVYQKSITVTTHNPHYNVRPVVNPPFDGQITWKDKDGVIRPLRYNKVSVKWHDLFLPWAQWTDVYTDGEGRFHMHFGLRSVDYRRDISFFIFSETENVVVSYHPDAKPYEYYYAVDYEVKWGERYDVLIDMQSDFGKAIEVAQAAENAAQYIKYLDNTSSIQRAKVVYPMGNNSPSYYTGASKTISLRGDEYHNWGMIGHEYGHHVQLIYGIAEMIGSTHYEFYNMCNVFKNGYLETPGDLGNFTTLSNSQAKSQGVKLAWQEGWATYFSICAIRHFATDLIDVSAFDRGDLFDEYCPDPQFAGEGNESVITSILFSLSDYDRTTGEFDKLMLPHKALWNSVKLSQAKQLGTFLQDVRTYPQVDNHSLGLLTGAYGVSASDIQIIHGGHAYDKPTITWSKGGASDYFTNNAFELRIYMRNGMYMMVNLGNVNTYTLTDLQWTNVKQVGGISRVVITGSDQVYYPTGPYFSYNGQHDVPTFQLLGSEAFPFDQYYYDFFIYQDMPFQYKSKNHYTRVEYFRTSIQERFVVLSPRHYEAGYAYLNFSFGFPIYWLNIELTMWSDSEFLLPSTSTAVIQYRNVTTGEWITVLDIIRDGDLSPNRLYSDYFDISLPFIYEFRIYMTSLKTGTQDLGRLCIGEMTIN